MSLFKLIKTGHVVEVYEFEKMPFKRGGGRTVNQSEKWEVHRIKNGKRVRERVRRLVTANFGMSDLFLTLTFRDGSVDDVTNVKECYKELDKFIKRLRRRFSNFKAIIVPEFQDKNGRGAVHYHMVCNIRYIEHEELMKIWGNGFVWVKRIEHVDNIGAYIVKYMSKNIEDLRLKGMKAYYRVGKLKEPEIVWLDGQEEVKEIIGDMVPVYQNYYGSEYHGRILYRQFNKLRKEVEK